MTLSINFTPQNIDCRAQFERIRNPIADLARYD